MPISSPDKKEFEIHGNSAGETRGKLPWAPKDLSNFALNIVPIENSIGISSMSTLRSNISHASNAKNFYSFLMCQTIMMTAKTLVARACIYLRKGKYH